MTDRLRSQFLTTLTRIAFAAGLLLVGPNNLMGCQTEAKTAEPSPVAHLIVSTHQWIGSDGETLPFKTDDEILDFLATADIVEVEKIPEGVTKPQKLYLEKEGIKAAAVFRYKEIYKKRWDDPKAGPRLDFRDSCVYECAAYRLGRLLGLNNIPPTLRRKVKGKSGTVQIWIEGAMTDTHRVRAKMLPPDTRRWAMQHQVMTLWDELVFNDDRHHGNVLIDQDWNVWMIDHTRSFRVYADVPKAKEIKYCERSIWENLKNLDEDLVKAELGDCLRVSEIEGLLKRKHLLLKHIEGLIEQRGEEAVLFQFGPPKNRLASSTG